MSRVPGQTFKNTLLVLHFYLHLFLCQHLHIKEGLNSYLFLSLLFLGAAVLSHKLSAEICHGLALRAWIHMAHSLNLHHM